MLQINKNGSRFWRDTNGQFHRLEGPAVEFSDGYKAWYIKGKRHRVDGPACECSNGSKAWYIKGKRHRVNGPAYEYRDGSKEYWLNDKEYTEEEYQKRVKRYVRD